MVVTKCRDKIFTGTLIIDVGGTLLERSKDGPYTRVRNWLRQGIKNLDKKELLDIAQVILTSPSIEIAALSLSKNLGLDQREKEKLNELLLESDTSVYILPGAINLLSMAKQLNWRVLIATNAAAWSLPLPSSIMQYVDGILSSSDLGFIKQNTNFWELFISYFNLDKKTCLVVGNDWDADIASSRRSGLAAIQVHESDFSLPNLCELMQKLGSCPSDAIGLISGRKNSWGGDVVLPADNLEYCVQDVTRKKVIFCTNNKKIPGLIIRRSTLPPVASLKDSVDAFDHFVAWVVSSKDKRMSNIPSDLEECLIKSGLDLNSLDNRTKRHLISLIIEAHEPSIRQARIEEVIEFLRSEISV